MTTKAKLSDLWDTLSKTDPKHTKGFSRAGGFKGTAIKPMWVWQRLTELFGPCGTGWGFGQPTFQVVTGDNKETLVYCTVSAWHGKPENVLFGVGGDKVVSHIKANAQYNRPERWENDDEAFKKAFTDALMNAFKFLGVAADVHMGLFDDNKYVQAMREEFAGGNGHSVEQESAHLPADPLERAIAQPSPSPQKQQLKGHYKSKTALWAAFKAFDRELRGCGDLDTLDCLIATDDAKALIEQCKDEAEPLWLTGEGLPPEFEPLSSLINRLRNQLQAETEFAVKGGEYVAAG